MIQLSFRINLVAYCFRSPLSTVCREIREENSVRLWLRLLSTGGPGVSAGGERLLLPEYRYQLRGCSGFRAVPIPAGVEVTVVAGTRL